MRRLTNWIMWLGWLVLFASGVLFGFAVARAEAVEPVIRCVQTQSGGYWEPGIRTILPSGGVITTDVYRPLTIHTSCHVDEIATQVQAHEQARAEALATMRARVPLTAIHAACAKYYPTNRVLSGQCLVQATGAR
jgi:hypothetical protein